MKKNVTSFVLNSSSHSLNLGIFTKPLQCIKKNPFPSGRFLVYAAGGLKIDSRLQIPPPGYCLDTTVLFSTQGTGV